MPGEYQPGDQEAHRVFRAGVEHTQALQPGPDLSFRQ
jgi:hypothetical protein